MQKQGYTAVRPLKKRSVWKEWGSDFKKNGGLYLIALPVILFYILFHYKPMYGVIIAFKNFSPAKGILDSDWVGFRYFIQFLKDDYFFRLMRNTLTISVTTLIFSFPMPIILALLLNELRSKVFSRSVQLVAYLPHFISLIVICGLIQKFTSANGIITQLLTHFGGQSTSYLSHPKYFVPIYVISDIWQETGWNSIIYLAALTGVDTQLYEAAAIDGAGKWKQTLHVTLPGIMLTIVIMLILRIGALLSVGYEKIILLYSPITYETADVISTYVYRDGLVQGNWSYSTAIGLFNSVINFILLIIANTLSRKYSESSLW